MNDDGEPFCVQFVCREPRVYKFARVQVKDGVGGLCNNAWWLWEGDVRTIAYIQTPLIAF